jgi:hypothetical protein
MSANARMALGMPLERRCGRFFGGPKAQNVTRRFPYQIDHFPIKTLVSSSHADVLDGGTPRAHLRHRL